MTRKHRKQALQTLENELNNKLRLVQRLEKENQLLQLKVGKSWSDRLVNAFQTAFGNHQAEAISWLHTHGRHCMQQSKLDRL